MATGLITRSSVSVLALLVWLCGVNCARADEVPVCSMSRDEFVKMAFPDSALTKLHGGRLIKRARPPGMVVLAPAGRPGTNSQIESAFVRIAKENAALPTHSALVNYRNFSELLDTIEDLGNDNIFVLIAEYPTDSSESQQFRRALEYIVRWSRDVEALIKQSKYPGGFTSRSRTDLRTDDVKGTAVVMNPRSDDAQIGLGVYLAYYDSVSLSASSAEPFFRIFFEKTPESGPQLTLVV